MRHKNLVVYDSEQTYARNLTERLAEKKEVSFKVRMFREEAGVRAFAKEQKIDLLLVGEDCKCRQEVGAGKIFVLTKLKKIELSENEIPIEKYQSADEILGEILEACLEEGDTDLSLLKKTGKGRIIGIYSPIHRIGKTKFALELGKAEAKKAQTLYLNLEDYAGQHSYLGETKGQTMEDLLYYAKQEHNNLGLRLSAMAGQHGELDFIYPMPVAWDIRAVTAEEWVELFQQILEKGIYETLILDIGDSVQGLYDILGKCDMIYTLYTKERICQEKLKQYEANLFRLGYDEILERTVKQLAERR
ncbi:MAG: hypothetical protein PHW34_04635 [Hespellia sp.]|nr:hypothetical protein [Hespellia sp.]